MMCTVYVIQPVVISINRSVRVDFSESCCWWRVLNEYVGRREKPKVERQVLTARKQNRKLMTKRLWGLVITCHLVDVVGWSVVGWPVIAQQSIETSKRMSCCLLNSAHSTVSRRLFDVCVFVHLGAESNNLAAARQPAAGGFSRCTSRSAGI